MHYRLAGLLRFRSCIGDESCQVAIEEAAP